MRLTLLTPLTLHLLKARLDILNDKLAQTIIALKDARANGDLSENADYDSASESFEQLNTLIACLENLISNSNTLNINFINKDVIQIGAMVELEINGNEHQFIKVILCGDECDQLGQDEYNGAAFISINSPIGANINTATKSHTFSCGDEENVFEVLSIDYSYLKEFK